MIVETTKQSKRSHLSSDPNKRQYQPDQAKNTFAWVISTLLILLAFILKLYVDGVPSFHYLESEERQRLQASDLTMCYETCRLSVVESVPQNLTILKHPLPSTFDAWHQLIENARKSIDLAAYKSSLRGEHVLPTSTDYSVEGDQLFIGLLNAGLNGSIKIRMVENSPPKDKGDNADGIVLFQQGAVDRRTLNLQKIHDTGIMHSKFIITDRRDFYLGSANLDWRSLNQKLEMGVFVQDCPCLAKELSAVFDFYWEASLVSNSDEFESLIERTPPLSFNMHNKLRIKYKNVDTDVYIATSPKPANSRQTWDLDAIVHEIETAEKYLYIHVMDIFPVFLYSHNKEFWPTIDNAIRDAVIRGIHVKILSAALHYPKIGLNFFKSLELINEVSNRGSIEIKIFKVPTSISMHSLLRRERRTHKKFLVSDTSVVIGNSNWSGDYFEGTGTAIVIHQNQTGPQPLIEEMRKVFERDFDSPYSYTLDKYYEACITSTTMADFCETEKDASFLATPSSSSPSSEY